MTEYGLGIVLSFTDNASSGINGAVNSLGGLVDAANGAANSLVELAQLSVFSTVANKVGDGLLTAGKGVLGLFQRLLGSVKEVGSEFENFGVTLTALYGKEEEANKQIQKLLDFSVHSPFEVADVKDMLVMLKSQGIEAFDKVTGAVSGLRQENLAWIADMMAFKPDIPARRWRLAFTNYLGSGESRVLRNALDMGQIADILGHDIGATPIERMNDIIEILESKNLQGLSEKISKTWQGVQSNIDDAFTKLKKAVADNGVFGDLKNAFTSVAYSIMKLDDEQLSALGKTVAEGLNFIVKPLTKLAEHLSNLIGKIVELCETNPQLVKLIMTVTAIIGVVLTVGGAFLKVMSVVGMATLGIMQFGYASQTAGKVIRSSLLSMSKTLVPLAAVVSLIAFAWKTDFAGIKTGLTNFVKNTKWAFQSAEYAANKGFKGMTDITNEWKKQDTFWTNFAYGLTQLKVLWIALVEAWNTNTLSEDTFIKCQRLGILPLVTSILMLKYRFEKFIEGFVKGWKEMGERMKAFVEPIIEKLKGTFIGKALDRITKFFKNFASTDPEKWRQMGEEVGKLVAALLPLLVIVRKFKMLSSIGGIFSRIFVGRGRGEGKGNPVSNILGMKVEKSGFKNSLFAHPTVVLKMLGSVGIILGGVVGIVEILGMLSNMPYFNTFLKQGGQVLAQLASSILSLAAVVGVMGVLSFAVDKTRMTPFDFLKAVGSIAIMVGGLTALVYVLGLLSNIPEFGTSLQAGVAALDSVVPALPALVKITTVMGVLSYVFNLFDKEGDRSADLDIKAIGKSMLKMGIMIGLLTVAMGIIGAVVTKIPGALSGLANATTALNSVAKAVPAIATIAVVVGALCLAFSIFDPKGSNKGKIKGLDLDLDVRTIGKGLLKIGIIVGAITLMVGIIGGVINLFKGGQDAVDTGVSALNKIAGCFSILSFSALAGVSMIIMALSKLPVIGAVKGVANFAIIVVAITGLAAIIGGLSSALAGGYAEAAEFFTNAFDVISSIFNGLGKCLGSIVGGIGEGIANSVPKIGSKLSEFAENAAPFFKIVSGLDLSGISEFLKALTLVFGAFMGEEILEFLGIGEVNLEKIGKQLSAFAVGGKEFFDTVAVIKPEAFTNAGLMFEALDGMNNMAFKSGGLLQGLMGEVQFGKVGRQLGFFMKKSKDDFWTPIANIPTSSFTNAAELFKALQGLNNFALRKGGLVDAIAGELNLARVGRQLSRFMVNSEAFWAGLDGIKPAKAGRLFDALQGLNNISFRKGGLVDVIAGGLKLGSTGKQLSAFMNKSKGFWKGLNTITTSKTDKATAMFNALQGLNNINFRSGGLVDHIIGGLTLDKVGEQLGVFLEKSESFWNGISGITADKTDSASRLFNCLAVLNNDAFRQGGLSDFFKGTTSLPGLGEQLSLFLGTSNSFWGGIRGITAEHTARATAVFETLKVLGSQEALSAIAQGNRYGEFENLGSHLSGFYDNSKTFFTNITNFSADLAEKIKLFLGCFNSVPETIPDGGGLPGLGTNLNDFVDKSTGFFDLIKGLSLANVNAGVRLVTMIADMANTFQTIGNGSFNIEDIGTKLSGFATKVKEFVGKLQGMGSTQNFVQLTGRISAFGSSLDTALSNLSKFSNDISSLMSGIDSAVSGGFITMESTITNAFITVKQNANDTFNTLIANLKVSWTAMQNDATTGLRGFKSSVSTAFKGIKSTVSHIMSSVVSSVKSAVSKIESAFRNAKLIVPNKNVKVPSPNSGGVPGYATGGIFDKPSIIGVGEAGKEAVMPLERNTGWITGLAHTISREMTDYMYHISSNASAERLTSDKEYGYLTPTVVNNTTGGNTDNSITFAQGAIQINCQNASEKEARKMAETIMKYIKRKGELDRMLSYN